MLVTACRSGPEWNFDRTERPYMKTSTAGTNSHANSTARRGGKACRRGALFQRRRIPTCADDWRNEGHRSMRSVARLAATLATTTAVALLSTLTTVQAANAASPACSENWYPTSGIYSGRFLPSTSEHTYREFVLRTTFKFSETALEAYRCHGSATLE